MDRAGKQYALEHGSPSTTRRLPAIPGITAFEGSPDRGMGLARDMRARRALEEVGRPHDPVRRNSLRKVGCVEQNLTSG